MELGEINLPTTYETHPRYASRNDSADGGKPQDRPAHKEERLAQGIGLDALFDNKLTLVDGVLVRLTKQHTESRRPDALMAPPAKKIWSTPPGGGRGRDLPPPPTPPYVNSPKAPPPARLELGDGYRVTPETYSLDGVTRGILRKQVGPRVGIISQSGWIGWAWVAKSLGWTVSWIMTGPTALARLNRDECGNEFDFIEGFWLNDPQWTAQVDGLLFEDKPMLRQASSLASVQFMYWNAHADLLYDKSIGIIHSKEESRVGRAGSPLHHGWVLPRLPFLFRSNRSARCAVFWGAQWGRVAPRNRMQPRGPRACNPSFTPAALRYTGMGCWGGFWGNPQVTTSDVRSPTKWVSRSLTTGERLSALDVPSEISSRLSIAYTNELFGREPKILPLCVMRIALLRHGAWRCDTPVAAYAAGWPEDSGGGGGLFFGCHPVNLQNP
jgi:hypothetical protein